MIPTSLTLESLALPQDLYWNGKMEPSSPPSSELFPILESVESWLLEDNFANDILFVDNKNVDVKLNPSEFDDNFNHGEEVILELEFDVKEEPWSEVKSSSPQQLIDFESFESVFHHPSLVTKVQNPYEGDNCSKSIFNSATILTQLTPPQSPPQAALTPPQSPPQGPQDVKEVTQHQQQQQQQQHLEHQQQAAHHIIQSQQQQPRIPTLVYQNISNSSIPVTVSDLINNSPLPVNSSQLTFTPNPYNNVANQDIAQNCQIVDEIVETRAKELPDWQDEQSSEFNSSCFMSSLSPPSQSIDEDWGRSSPSSSDSSYSSVIGDSSSSSSDGCGGKMQTSSSLAKKRTRPYGRGPEDRKNRKKEQNKNAATRYRQKKKQEMEIVLTEEQELSNINKALSATLADRKREAKYLKKLILEFYQNKKL
ncbi:probable serine/threonine-protein kinase DDB_G0280111 isoform X2 [Episyrphus balteatus]|uniref:probable serine/threonine-protein kinase DDB_G0280111 isoform X2 n=1 Tax=Episyrphus balteatus TaxID=286459 RepID=UPI002486BF0D|nr:probable serine/threonine-protein kinase DDB_G0280111 isoform X2 [Episyrphus balteatus]